MYYQPANDEHEEQASPLYYFKEFWKNYGNFHGYTSVKGYWFAMIPIIIIQSLLMGGSFGIFNYAPEYQVPSLFLMLLSLAFGVAIFIPTLSITSRRLADAGFSRWLVLLLFTPLSIIVFVLTFFPTTKRNLEY